MSKITEANGRYEKYVALYLMHANDDTMSPSADTRLFNLPRDEDHDTIEEALHIVGHHRRFGRASGWNSERLKYFNGILRNLRRKRDYA